jgi:hypothetical protein
LLIIRNPGAHAIEDELESAIIKAGGIKEENIGNLKKV